jgi:hypothetical protein
MAAPEPEAPQFPKMTNERIRQAVAAFAEEGGGKGRADFLHSPNAEAEYGPVAGWDVSEVTDFSGLFDGYEKFNVDISGWDVSGAEGMRCMFAGAAAFNQPIGGWSVGAVTNMNEMFSSDGASAFDQDLSRWAVGAGTNTHDIFERCYSFSKSKHAPRAQGTHPY